MPRKRRTQWVEGINTAYQDLLGAAAPGTVLDEVIVSEGELENFNNPTIIRVVGDILLLSSLGRPVVTATLWVAPRYADAILPSDWDQDAFQRGSVMWTKL